MLYRCAVLLVACLACCSRAPAPAPARLPTSDGGVQVKSWVYQLAGPEEAGNELRPEPLAAVGVDLVVMDYARHGDEATKFTPQEIDRIKRSDREWGGTGQRKLVLAYLSIGEAEDFRSHWDQRWTADGKAAGRPTRVAPAWLGPANPDWPECRKVRYWDPAWQAVLFNDQRTGWLDRVLAQGFDGAYLDVIDAYEFWSEDQKEKSPREAAAAMIDLVVALSAHARKVNPKFVIVPQNGVGIIDALDGKDPARAKAYRDAISAVAAEDTYYSGDADENNPLKVDQEVIGLLKEDFAAHGQPVLVIEYLNDPAKVADFLRRAIADGFIPYAAPSRGLEKRR